MSAYPASTSEPSKPHVTFAPTPKKDKSVPVKRAPLRSLSSMDFTLKQPIYQPVCQPSWREELAVRLDTSSLGSIWKLFDALLNITLCVIYVSNTNLLKTTIPPGRVLFEFIVAVLLVIQYAPKFYITEFTSWRSLFTRSSPILTVLAVFPTVVLARDSNFGDTPELVFFYPFRFIRCYLSVCDCLVRSEKSVLHLGQVTSKVAIFATSVLFLVLTGSSLLHGVEFVYQEQPITFLDAVFFTTIMLGTVGYLSDIVPHGPLPRLMLLCIFVMGFIFIPYSITEILILVRSKSPYDKAYRKVSLQPHVIIIPPTIELPSLRHFLKEFYSLAHGPVTINTKVVILNPADPTERVQTFLSDPVYAHRVQYIRGSSLESRSLVKTRAKQASAYFILAKKYTQQSEAIDAENVLKAIALRKYNEGPKLYIQCILPENKIHFESLNPEQIICTDELKLAILAHSCLTPGFSTILYGLTTSFAHETEDEERASKESSDVDYDVMEDYLDGLSQSIYTTTMSDHFSGTGFLAVAGRLYEALGVVLFAIGIPKKRSLGKYATHWLYDGDADDNDFRNYTVLINPGDYVVKGDEIAFVIASNAPAIERISTFEEQYPQTQSRPSMIGPPPSEREPLLSADTLKNNGGGDYFGTIRKVREQIPRTPSPDHMHYPHKPESISSRRQRALSTPLALSTDHGVEHHHGHQKSHSHPNDYELGHSLTHPYDNDHLITVLENITDHIILCDYSTTFPRNLDCFVSPLRMSHLERIIPVVILSPTRPSTSQWKILSQFDQVYIVQGNPMTREGLECARVKYARQAVVLSDSTRILKNGEKIEDAPAMLVFLNIKAMCQNDIDIFVEFVHTDNMKFMSEDSQAIEKNLKAHHSPAFMQGTCFSPSMLDSIICQSFYQPHLVATINQILFGAPPLHLPSGATCPAPAHSHLFKIAIPQLYVGYEYGSLFKYMLEEKKAVPLGLYRRTVVKSDLKNGKELRYVHTCPKYNVILREDDMIFVFSKKAPVIN